MTNDKGRCVWRKSSYSGGQGNCVEVAVTESVVSVRDSKDSGGAVLTVNPEEWRAFLHMLKLSTQ
jgi:hypothetical protein